MKRAEMLKWCKANGIKIPIGTKTHEALRIIRESGVEVPDDLKADMEQIVEDAKAKEKAEWMASQEDEKGAEEVEGGPVNHPEAESVWRQVGPDAVAKRAEELRDEIMAATKPKDEAFVHVFNSMEPGRGYTLQELTEAAGFEVTHAHFDEAVARDIAFPKSGNRWVRRPKNLGENLL